MKWMSREDLASAALSTAMRKVFSAFEKHYNVGRTVNNSRKRKRADQGDGRKQMVLDAFFKSKN